MKDLYPVFAIVAAALAAGPATATGVIENACLRSDRPGVERALCNCLQRVADATLSARDQNRGAAFFADPHKSQEVKASDRAADQAFWENWETFAATAVTHCQ